MTGNRQRFARTTSFASPLGTRLRPLDYAGQASGATLRNLLQVAEEQNQANALPL